MPDAQTQADFAARIVEKFAAGVVQALAALGAGDASFKIKPAAAPAPDSEALWWEEPLDICPAEPLRIGAPKSAWYEAGKRVLSSAGIDEEDAASIRSTYIEVLSQALAAVAIDLGSALKCEVNCLTGKEGTPPAEPCPEIEIDLAGTPFSLYIDVPAAVAAECERATAVQPAAPAKADSRAVALSQTEQRQPKEKLNTPLDVLLDVELPVSISFGRAQLPLKDVIKLTTGSIVELNRSVAEPVEVIVNNCVIARGEVVVVEGNYGVRIKQVISRAERLRTLK